MVRERCGIRSTVDHEKRGKKGEKREQKKERKKKIQEPHSARINDLKPKVLPVCVLKTGVSFSQCLF